MIVTIALNPGIEKHIKIEHLIEGEEIPIQNYNLNIEKSAVFSAYIMKVLQADPYVLGFAGGIGGRYIKNFLDKSRVKSNLIQKDKELRSTFIIETGLGSKTCLVDNQHEFDEADQRNLKHQLVGQIDECELMYMNGILDQGIGEKMLLEALDMAIDARKKTVLYLENGSIEAFLLKKPFALVVTEEHLESMDQGDQPLKEQLAYLRSLAMIHKIHFIFYVKEKQVIGVTKSKIAFGDVDEQSVSQVPWKVDAIAGGLTIGIKRKYELEKLVKLLSGIACAVGMNEEGYLCTRKDIETASKKTKVKTLFAAGAFQDVVDDHVI